mmetsp:Transcript_1055/g.1887  ORF Transcript_1055/g.1887 Transcript_1055/m.1887 type:complete len:293 (-) Transcript_1055:984-1862(-)|eukprot:CAMPEP_0176501838 /NCGR_PEP_ID=MMETSP0200_2-20121128/14406_1 /TAXON_ID=947934 /ORGANISM="Chaetoceros sp., Strain GSL56" /LENGTH=292 /DNA_ID=CAMNT_0017900815 /DNA_START=1803 /DNA_END=2681 /DNA_ORIENTATION=-
MSSASEPTQTSLTASPLECPLVTRDARFRAAKKLKQSGRVHLGAIPMLETLANRAEEEFGTTNIETATVYYELGHAMYLKMISTSAKSVVDENYVEEALEYMAKACSILYDYVSNWTIENDSDYSTWAKDEIPRHLIGIGNVQSFQIKHADAIESYLNALSYREEACVRCKDQSVVSLRYQRLLTECYILIAEEMLVCKPGQDVLHSETGTVVVKGEDVISLAQTYYEQAREKLQDIVYLMATLEGEPSQSSESEKQDICHLATMLVEVGMGLAEQKEQGTSMNSASPSKKK